MALGAAMSSFLAKDGVCDRRESATQDGNLNRIRNREKYITSKGKAEMKNIYLRPYQKIEIFHSTLPNLAACPVSDCPLRHMFL
jgi:hypothetical protein